MSFISKHAAGSFPFALVFLLSSARADSAPTSAFESSVDLEITLFAAEPNVVDPVALTFDEKGKMYVVEMRDYPLGIGPEHKPGGTVRLLEDRDGDGRADHSSLFAEGLSFPTSIAPWNGGVLVTAPPDIIFLKDADGDGRADIREVLLSGFKLGVTDSNVNGLRWGLDNRVHGVNGGNGGIICSPRHPDRKLSLRDCDFSFDPNTGDVQLTYHTSGGFGLEFDEWGHSFATYNIDHIQQRIIPARYLMRFPGMLPERGTASISDHGEMARIFPASAPVTRVNHPEQAGHFSAAGGLGVLVANFFPGGQTASILVCDVVGNLVHRDLLLEEGPIYRATRAPGEQRREFLASKDPACRPVGLELGPDGALYLIDMQRDVIEHPDYIPEKVKAALNLRAGSERGRIYRIRARQPFARRSPDLGKASRQELVRALADPNQWTRTTAQRLLVERNETAAVAELRKLLSSVSQPLGRLHALWTLAGLNRLAESDVLKGLQDPAPDLRAQACLLGETRFNQNEAVRNGILALADDSNPRVRWQAALGLGGVQTDAARAALLKIFLSDLAWRWSRLAVLSSISSGEGTFFEQTLASARFAAAPETNRLAAVRELSDLLGARIQGARGTNFGAWLSALEQRGSDEAVLKAAFDGLRQGLTRSGDTAASDPELAQRFQRLARGRSPGLLAAAWQVERKFGFGASPDQAEILSNAARVALDSSAPLAERIDHIRLLGAAPNAPAKEALLKLLGGNQPEAIQAETVDVLRQFQDASLGERLVAEWRSLGPAVRPRVLEILLQRRAFHSFLLTALESGKIMAGELNLDLEQRRVLLRKSTADIQARAAKLFGDEEYSNRKATVADWLKRLPETGDATRGRTVFEKSCTPCHAVGGLGNQVGPDLSTVAHRSVEDILSNILDPNMAINPRYVSYAVEAEGDELASGILFAQTADAVTLLQAYGRKVVIPRNRIKRMESTGISLMPEGLEAGLTPPQLRDLIAFIQAAVPEK